MNWRRSPGRPRKIWIQQIRNGTPAVSWRQMWQSADERGHHGELSQRTTAVYASWWWCVRSITGHTRWFCCSSENWNRSFFS